MASLKSAMKGHQKTHRERGQVGSRKHLGLLEKHKDYVLRAKDFHRKEKLLKTLKRKAQERNPDEFYFQMINTKTKDGVHMVNNKKTYTHDQIQLLKTQDMNYINYKRNVESKKIEKLQANLHMIESADNSKRSHVFFVDSKQEVKDFDAVKQFDTLPELVLRSHNIPKLDMLHSANFDPGMSEHERRNIKKQQKRSYLELENRINRETQLEQARQGLEKQRQLMGKGKVYKRKQKDGKASYRWRKMRKR